MKRNLPNAMEIMKHKKLTQEGTIPPDDTGITDTPGINPVVESAPVQEINPPADVPGNKPPQVDSFVELSAEAVYGAIAAFESMTAYANYSKSELLVKARDLKLHKKAGFDNFYDFCEAKLQVGKTKAAEIVKLSDKLQLEVYLALEKLGLKKKELLLLAKDPTVKGEVRGDKCWVTINGTDVECTPQDKPILQRFIDEKAQADRLNAHLQSQNRNLRREIRNNEEYIETLNHVKATIQSTFNDFRLLKEQIKDDPEKRSLFYTEVASIELWASKLKTEMLDEIQTDPDEESQNEQDDELTKFEEQWGGGRIHRPL